MASDVNLIEGAYRAAAAGAMRDTGVSRGITEMVKKIGDFGAKKHAEGENYMALANQVLNEGGELSASEYDALYDELKKGQFDYIWGDNKVKSRKIRDLNMAKKDMTDLKELKNYIGETTASNMFRTDFEESMEFPYIMDLMKDQKNLISYECPPDRPDCEKKGRKGIMMPDSQAVDGARADLMELNYLMDSTLMAALSDPNLQRDANGNPILSDDVQAALDKIDDQILESQSIIDNDGMRFVAVNEVYDMIKTKDDKFRNFLDAHLMETMVNSSKLDFNTDLTFNRDLNEDIIRRFMIRGSDIKSIVYDSYNGRSFYEDFVDNLIGTEYGELGIEEGDLINYAKQFNVKGINYEDGIDEKEESIIRKTHKLNEEKMQHYKQVASDYLENNLGQKPIPGRKGLSSDEAKVLAKTIINDKKYVKELEDEVVDYYTNMAEKQWNIGSNSRVKRTKKDDNDDGSIDFEP